MKSCIALWRRLLLLLPFRCSVVNAREIAAGWLVRRSVKWDHADGGDLVVRARIVVDPQKRGLDLVIATRNVCDLMVGPQIETKFRL